MWVMKLLVSVVEIQRNCGKFVKKSGERLERNYWGMKAEKFGVFESSQCLHTLSSARNSQVADWVGPVLKATLHQRGLFMDKKCYNLGCCNYL